MARKKKEAIFFLRRCLCRERGKSNLRENIETEKETWDGLISHVKEFCDSIFVVLVAVARM